MLKDCCEIKPPKSEAKKLLAQSDLVSFVPMKSLGINTVELELELELEDERPLSSVTGSYTYFAENDVLLAKITPCFENGKLGIAKGLTNGIGFGSSEFIVFRPIPELLPEYLYFFLLRPIFREQGQAVMTGTVGHKRVPKHYIESAKIPLPPIEEQKRIVTTLDRVFADIDQARATAETNLKNARELFDSYLHQVFSNSHKGWKVMPLEDLANIINGYAFKSADFSPQNQIKSIKITNVGVYEFVEESANLLPQRYSDEYSRYKAFEGDVVIALTRTIISSGLKVAVVSISYHGALVNQRVAVVQVNEELIPKEILKAFLITKIAMDYVKNNVNELMQPNLSIKDLKAFPIPIPPKKGVETISNDILLMKDKTNQLIKVYSSKINALDELKKPILQKAFTGELTKNKVTAA
jgi:type I restriction enzyme S subunit